MTHSAARGVHVGGSTSKCKCVSFSAHNKIQCRDPGYSSNNAGDGPEQQEQERRGVGKRGKGKGVRKELSLEQKDNLSKTHRERADAKRYRTLVDQGKDPEEIAEQLVADKPIQQKRKIRNQKYRDKKKQKAEGTYHTPSQEGPEIPVAPISVSSAPTSTTPASSSTSVVILTKTATKSIDEYSQNSRYLRAVTNECPHALLEVLQKFFPKDDTQSGREVFTTALDSTKALLAPEKNRRGLLPLEDRIPKQLIRDLKDLHATGKRETFENLLVPWVQEGYTKKEVEAVLELTICSTQFSKIKFHATSGPGVKAPIARPLRHRRNRRHHEKIVQEFVDFIVHRSR